MKKIAANRNYRLMKKASIEWSSTDGGCNYYGQILEPENLCSLLANKTETNMLWRNELVELRERNNSLLKENESLRKELGR